MGHEVVHRLVDRLTAEEPLQVLHQEVVIQRVGVVEVHPAPLLQREVVEALVVGVVVHEDRGVQVERIVDPPRHGGLPRAGPPSDSDDERLHPLAPGALVRRRSAPAQGRKRTGAPTEAGAPVQDDSAFRAAQNR